MELRLVVFDIDGTLVDSQALILEGFAHAFATVGRGIPSRRAVLDLVGLSLPEAVRGLLPDASAKDQAAVVQAYRAHYTRLRAEHGAAAVPLFSGAREAVETLAARPEVLIGAATGMARRGLDHVLDVHGLTHHFVTRQSADLHPSKPHPAMLEAALAEAGVAPVRAVMVGDTTFDIGMAVAARVAGIGVSWGHHPAAALQAAGAVRVVDSFAALIATIDEVWEAA